MSFNGDINQIVELNENGLLGSHTSWERVALEKVAAILNGYPFDSKSFNKTDGVPLIRIRDILRDDTDTKYDGEVPHGYWINQGDLLVGMDGDFNCATWRGPAALLNQRVCKISGFSDFIDTSFLYRVLGGYLAAINSYTSSITVKHLSSKTIASIPLPLPPLNEQRRIAAKLDATLAAVDACRQRLDGVAAILKRFRQAVLAAATSGELTREWREDHPDEIDASSLAAFLKSSHSLAGGHKRGNAAPPTDGVHDLNEQQFPEGWRLVELRDIVKPDRPITYGILKPGPELVDGVPYIRVADYPGNKLNIDLIKKTSFEIDEAYKRSRLEAGDLLLSIRGTVGRLISIPPELERANITQDSARLSLQEVLCASYIEYALHSDILQSRMRRAVKGVAVRGINIGDVRALQVPIPSIQEQEEISRHVEFLFTLAGQLEARLNVARKIVVRLTLALLAKAFHGELVPQDPNDEPASVLLERIRTASNTRSAGSAASQRGRRKTRENSEQRSLVPTNDPSRLSLKSTVTQATQAENDLRLVSKSKLPDILKGRNLMQNRLIQILEQHQAWIPASKACEELGISDGSSSDDLELFYSQLKEHVEDGLVVVQRRGDEDWLMLSSREVA